MIRRVLFNIAVEAATNAVGLPFIGQAAANIAADGAAGVAERRWKPKPTVNGNKVFPALTQAYRDAAGSIEVSRLTVEDFDRFEPANVKQALELASLGMWREAETLGDVLHLVDVTDNDPVNWWFRWRGRNRARSLTESARLCDIPWLNADVAIDGYARCKMRGARQYDYLARNDWDPVRYRRLQVPILDRFGNVCRVAVILNYEERSKIFGGLFPAAKGDVERRRLASEFTDYRAIGAGDAGELATDLMFGP